MKLLLVGVAVVVGMALWLTTGKEKKMSELRIAVPRVNLNNDPHDMEDILSMFLVQQTHRALFRFNSQGQIIPDMAKAITVSTDKLLYTIVLQENQTFVDGTPITARDVVASFKRPFQMGSAISADMAYIEGARESVKSKNTDKIGIRAKSESIVEISLASPSDLLLTHLALPDLAIVRIDEKKQIVSAGQYVLVSRSPEQIVLKKTAIAPGSAPETVVLIKKSYEEALRAAEAGEVDCLEPFKIKASDNQKLQTQGWYSVVHSLAYNNFLLMNPKKISRSVRERMVRAASEIDFAKHLDETEIHIRPSFGLIPENLPGNLKRSDLTEIRQPLPKSEPARVRLAFNSENPLHEKAAALLKERLSHLKVDAIVEPLTSEDYYATVIGKKAEAVIVGKGIDYPDGLANLTYFRTDIDANFFYLEDDSLNRDLEHLAFISTPERYEKYRELQIKILSQKTVASLFFGDTSAGVWSPKVLRVPPHPFGFHFLRVSEVQLR